MHVKNINRINGKFIKSPNLTFSSFIFFLKIKYESTKFDDKVKNNNQVWLPQVNRPKSKYIKNKAEDIINFFIFFDWKYSIKLRV